MIDLHDGLPRGRHAKHVGVPPQSYFEPTSNLRATESLSFNPYDNQASKWFLGVCDAKIVSGQRLRDGRANRYAMGGQGCGLGDDRHLVLIAGSRSGKGRSVLIPNLICLPGSTSILCLDPKGDLAKYTARYRADGLGQRVGVLDPFGVSGPATERFRIAFNPLSLLDPENRQTFIPNAKLIADSLIVSGDHQDRHWDETAKQILSGLCAHVRTHERYQSARDLVTVWQLVAELATRDPDNPHQYWLQQEMQHSDAASGMISNAARQFYDRTGGEFSSVLSNLRRHTDWIGIECMQDCLSGESIDLRDLKRDSITIYSALPAMRMGDLSGWNRLLVQLSLAAHEEVQIQSGDSTVMMLDEFNVLGHLACLETAAAQIAGLGVKIVAVIQDLGQLQSKYPKSWETFIANAGALQIFGLADQTSLEYASKRLGQATCVTRSTNAPSFDQATQQAATGESWSLSVHPLLDPEELGRSFSRDDKLLRQLILRPGFRPAILQRAFYDKHEFFAGRFDDAR
ncbi:Conjugal transfer protein TraG [Rubripirellula lacrimiformis]|uniref:Conjugal transfer protein TraG n=1 Tax=Rubripirellula lacrimiformis TaxID=1930273 RepID=A0A517NK44_9BACT|nr:type IV secretory system conjugative DNA transfer family protein [Rubripirellula lacrimiformis]QDT07490.1 Conjugal transfer protein TraG [Rubripirellula lacrimiformis]